MVNVALPSWLDYEATKAQVLMCQEILQEALIGTLHLERKAK